MIRCVEFWQKFGHLGGSTCSLLSLKASDEGLYFVPYSSAKSMLYAFIVELYSFVLKVWTPFCKFCVSCTSYTLCTIFTIHFITLYFVPYPWKFSEPFSTELYRFLFSCRSWPFTHLLFFVLFIWICYCYFSGGTVFRHWGVFAEIWGIDRFIMSSKLQSVRQVFYHFFR